MEFTGKVVVITGGSGGIGSTTAKIFAENGAKLVLVGTSTEKTEQKARDLGLKDGDYLALAADVSKDNDVKAYVDASMERFGRIDVFFNNSGVEGSVANTADITWGARYDYDLGGSQLFRQLNLLFAVLGFFFFFLQFLLSTRHPVVEKGFGPDKIILKHRHVGRTALGFLLLHPVFFFLFQGGVLVSGISMTIGLIVLLGLVVAASLASLHKKLSVSPL